MSQTTVVEFEGLYQGADDLSAVASRIAEALARLEGRLSPLHHLWTGAAAGAYTVAMTSWTTSLQSMNETLAAIAAAVGTSSTTYATTESENRTLWA